MKQQNAVLEPEATELLSGKTVYNVAVNGVYDEGMIIYFTDGSSLTIGHNTGEGEIMLTYPEIKRFS